ncbi:MAG: lysophospholipid acyltransferase family protein [Thermosynechococcaceae cyanobacterium]
MFWQNPLELSRAVLTSIGTHINLIYSNRIPVDSTMLVVSNHRSFMDAPLLMAALNQPIRFAYHHYISQVPVLRETVGALGGFPLEATNQRQQLFFQQASHFLQTRQIVGIFPEGSQPMVQPGTLNKVGDFRRGFAHLAMRSPLPKLAVLPVAIASQAESIFPGVPLPLLRFFDPSEPLFNQLGWHPLILYHRVQILVGRPYWITLDEQKKYRGKLGKVIVNELTHYCQTEISDLLHNAGGQNAKD